MFWCGRPSLLMKNRCLHVWRDGGHTLKLSTANCATEDVLASVRHVRSHTLREAGKQLAQNIGRKCWVVCVFATVDRHEGVPRAGGQRPHRNIRHLCGRSGTHLGTRSTDRLSSPCTLLDCTSLVGAEGSLLFPEAANGLLHVFTTTLMKRHNGDFHSLLSILRNGHVPGPDPDVFRHTFSNFQNDNFGRLLIDLKNGHIDGLLRDVFRAIFVERPRGNCSGLLSVLRNGGANGLFCDALGNRLTNLQHMALARTTALFAGPRLLPVWHQRGLTDILAPHAILGERRMRRNHRGLVVGLIMTPLWEAHSSSGN